MSAGRRARGICRRNMAQDGSAEPGRKSGVAALRPRVPDCLRHGATIRVGAPRNKEAARAEEATGMSGGALERARELWHGSARMIRRVAAALLLTALTACAEGGHA